MTCTVGLVHEGRVYLGADSLASNGDDAELRADPKVIRRGKWAIGFAGSYAVGQCVQHLWRPPALRGALDMRYWVGRVRPSLIIALREHGAIPEEALAMDASLLLGRDGMLVTIDADFHVSVPLRPYAAIGSGAAAARGALYRTEGEPPRDRIVRALEAAEEASSFVRRPWVLV